MRKRRWLAAAATAGVVLLPLGRLGASDARDAGGGFVARASAHAGRLTFTIPAFAVVETILDGGGPVAEANLQSTGGSSFASLPYPGENGIAFPGLFATLTGQPLPFTYPFYAAASHPTAPEAAVRDPSGVYDLHATAGTAEAVGRAQLRGWGGEGANSGQGGAISRATVKADGVRATATAETVSEALSLGGGALRVASVRSRSETVYEPGGEPVTETDLIVEGGQAGGYSFAYDASGLVVANQGVPLPADSGLDQLNAALTPSGLSLRVVKAAPVEGGAAADSFEVLSKQGSPAPGVPGAVLRLSFGGATTSVQAGSGGPLPDFGPPANEVSAPPVETPPTTMPAPPAEVTPTTQPVPDLSPPPPAPEVAPTGGSSPAAPPTLDAPATAGSAPVGVPAPAATSGPALAAPVYEPILRSRGIGSLDLVYGSAIAFGLVALALATLWRAKGVTH